MSPPDQKARLRVVAGVSGRCQAVSSNSDRPAPAERTSVAPRSGNRGAQPPEFRTIAPFAQAAARRRSEMDTKRRRIQFSRRTPALLGSLLAFVVFVSLAVPAAAAGTPIAASGSYQQVSFVPSNFTTVGGVTFFDFTEHDSLSGTLSGTSVIQGSCVTLASGETLCQALETFTGEVAGQGGAGATVQFRDVVAIDPTGTVSGSFTVVAGTGALTNLHGHGTFHGTSTGSYTALLVFAP
jgi:hypothetical protein